MRSCTHAQWPYVRVSDWHSKRFLIFQKRTNARKYLWKRNTGACYSQNELLVKKAYFNHRQQVICDFEPRGIALTLVYERILATSEHKP